MTILVLEKLEEQVVTLEFYSPKSTRSRVLHPRAALVEELQGQDDLIGPKDSKQQGGRGGALLELR